MKASDAVARFLDAHRVNHCFELVGGMITHLLDSFAQSGKFTIISMHHEQSAAFAAEGVARQTMGKSVAVAMGTSGPGATNLITGIGSCWFDSIPCLFITGQVNTSELKGNSSVRQQGFQELDIIPMVSSITKYAVQVTDANNLLPELYQALSATCSGRKGPALIDIPNDVQRMDIPDEIVNKWLTKPLPADNQVLVCDALEQLVQMLKVAERPLFCIGGGARWAPAMPAWLDALEKRKLPYVSTLMGHERVVAGPHYFNMIGSYGNREANWAVQNCDLLIVIGARLDVRQTGADVRDFARNAKIVQIDIDPAQLNNRIQADLSINCDAQTFFTKFPITEVATTPKQLNEWIVLLAAQRARASSDEYADWKISPSRLFTILNEKLLGKSVDYVCDVGNHQMWAAQNIRLGKGQAVHYSGGMGAMGFALPAAIGIALASGTKTIVITGDGSLQINIQELDTIVRLNLNIVIVVMNNASLGMVKNFQDMYFDGRNQSTKVGYSFPTFTKLAKAYGIEALSCSSSTRLADAINKVVNATGPILLEVVMPYATECRPRLAFGKKLDEQYPYQQVALPASK